MAEPDASDPPMLDGARPARYVLYDHGAARSVDAGVIDEGQVCVFVNGAELATFRCLPVDVHELALGFLRLERVIDGLEDVRSWRVADGGSCVDVWLNKAMRAPGRPITTSGCGGGVTFDDASNRREPLASALTVSPEQITGMMRAMQQAAALYRAVRGVHTSALSDGHALLSVTQDIGRHNTLDRLCGRAMLAGMDTRDLMLLSSGRISSEMIGKAATLGAPIVVSRTSPTSASVALGQAWNVAVIGYCRGDVFRVYSAPERVRGAPPETPA